MKTTEFAVRVEAFLADAQITTEEQAQIRDWLDANGWPRTPSMLFHTRRPVTEEERERFLAAVAKHLSFGADTLMRLDAYRRRN